MKKDGIFLHLWWFHFKKTFSFLTSRPKLSRWCCLKVVTQSFSLWDLASLPLMLLGMSTLSETEYIKGAWYCKTTKYRYISLTEIAQCTGQNSNLSLRMLWSAPETWKYCDWYDCLYTLSLVWANHKQHVRANSFKTKFSQL